MWRSKKFIIIALMATLVLVGSIGGVALAQTENNDDSQPNALFERVTAILVDKGINITSEQLKDAFAQAQSDVRTEAIQNRLDKLVEEGIIDGTQAQELLDWREARPDVPARFGFKGHGGFRGMHGMRGFGGLCAPVE